MLTPYQLVQRLDAQPQNGLESPSVGAYAVTLTPIDDYLNLQKPLEAWTRLWSDSYQRGSLVGGVAR